MTRWQLIIIPTLSLLAAGCAIEQPFEGPGYTGGALTTQADGPFTAATTHIKLKDSDDASATFDKHMATLQEKLKDAPGLVGASLSFVPFNNDEYRTLTVWESDAAMMRWVMSDAHAAAMVEMGDKTEGGRTVTWKVTRQQTPPSWDDARARLDADGRDAY